MIQGPNPEIAFMRTTFSSYYQEAMIEPPHRFARREWGFFPFGGKMMFRHIAFRNREELDAHFKRSVPMHAYHSAAYYQDPGVQPMAEKVKGWMGADLIFDLDADHIPGAEELGYVQQLAIVKGEVIRLLEDFILDDLGFPRSSTYLFFSGGRGYHVHVRDPNVLNLLSNDRRAIVDYITGRGFSIDVAFPKEVVQVNPRFGSSKSRRNFRGADWGGWVRKVHTGKDRLITELSALEPSLRTKRLKEIARAGRVQAGDQIIASLDESLFGRSNGRSASRLKGSGLFDVFPNNQQLELFLRLVVSYSSISLSGETDEPVTTDTKRLIRAVSTLHGKTGLRVTSIPLDRIDEFDPLRDAVALGDERVDIVVEKGSRSDMAGDSFVLEKGANTVPLFLAYFLIGRREARLPPHMRTGAE